MSQLGSISHETRYGNSQKEILTSQTRSIFLRLTLFMTNTFKKILLKKIGFVTANDQSHFPLKIAYHLKHRLFNIKKQQRYIIKKMINVAIRATYYIFCRSNRNWDSPDLIQFLFFYFFLAFVLFFLFVFFLFNNPISSSICKLPIRSEIYIHSKTQIKFPLLLSLLLDIQKGLSNIQ